ncbi:MAG: LacI family DNA-binding transcriptional regulator [Alphaproteobacteria bacterium]
MATIKDVAARSGVSIKTVSRVMNSPEAVSALTRDRVMNAVHALQFVPDRRARAMRSGRSHVVGFLSDSVATTPFSVDLIRGAQEALAERRVTMLLANADDGAFAEHLRDFQGFRVDGVIIATGYHRPIDDPPPAGTHAVLVNCYTRDQAFPAVVPDDRQAGLTATRHLIGLGHRRIGFVTLPADIDASRLRLAGFRQAHADAGLSVDDSLVREGIVWVPGGQQMIAFDVARALIQRPDRPAAIVCGNDIVAMHVYNAARAAGLRIPEDISIIGFDDNVVVATGLMPTLTTVALPYAAMGRRAAALLLDPETVRPDNIARVECPLVDRRSCAPAVPVSRRRQT